MMDKFAEFEQKLRVTQSDNDNKALNKQIEISIVTEERLAIIKDTFNN